MQQYPWRMPMTEKENKEAQSSSHLTASQPLLRFVPLALYYRSQISQAHVNVLCVLRVVREEAG